ncbi:helix-turn-helix domain-containing protein [Thioclava sp. 'Guangxiensis']|uniref:LexA family transcriptional regulator n=1 Tax=Thioclava sp. 'Guangxiensis' TaxID=3149044 RepID=UPI003877A749
MKIDIKSALEKRNMSQQQLADAIDVGKGYLSEIVNGKKKPSFDVLVRILEALDADISEIATTRPPIAVPGYAGAGDEVSLVDDYVKGNGMYKIQCPPQISPKGIVAVEIRGDSMEPAYSSGDIVLFSRDTHDGVPTEAIGRKVIAETSDGMIWLKYMKEGTEAGTFSLLSLNPTGRNLHNVHLKWAAPVRFHIPKDLVNKQ